MDSVCSCFALDESYLSWVVILQSISASIYWLCLCSTGISLTSQNSYQAVDKALQDIQAYIPNKVPLEQVYALEICSIAVKEDKRRVL